MAEVEVQSSADPSSSSRQFPAGLRVLVVDDDSTCLVTMEMMLSKCLYNVTTCTGAKFALSLLRENKGSFDIVLSDVHMPEMNGFELLEIVGLEMDVPVIMMSCDSEANVVMRGMKHGACDYLAKPVRMEVLRNIWQHALRKKERIDQTRRVSGDAANATRNDVADDTSKPHKNKRDGKENDGDDSGEISSKKPRVSWTPNLHRKFLTAVSKLGIDKAAPKGILELMKVPNLTRGNVASHLQKFRWYLKNLTEGKQFGQMPPDLVAALSAQMLGRVTNLGDRNYSQKVSNMLLPILRQQQPHPLLQESPHAVNLQPSCHFPNQPSNTFQAAVQSQQLTSFQAGKNPFLLNWNNPLVVQTVNNHLLMNPNNRLLMDQNSERIPTQPLANFGAGNNPIIMSQAENRPIPINQRSNYILFYGTRQISAEDCNNVGGMSNSSVPGSVPSPVSYIRPSGGLGGPNSGNNHNPGMMETDQGQRRNVNFVDQGTCIAARCVINDVRSPENNLSEDEDLLKEYFLEDIFDGSTEDEDPILPDILK